MADTLVFQNEAGQVINNITFKRTIKGIPSLITSFYFKNESERLNFKGKLIVTPSFGISYSEDLSISETGENWSRFVEVNIPPLSRKEIKARVLPITTPTGFSGKSSITITGSWLQE